VDGFGNVVVGDFNRSRIVIFNSMMQWCQTIDIRQQVEDVAISGSGKLYVATGQDSVLIYSQKKNNKKETS
jgi:hypothetical protein